MYLETLVTYCIITEHQYTSLLTCHLNHFGVVSRFITTKLGKLGKSYEALLLCLVGHLYLRFNYRG